MWERIQIWSCLLTFITGVGEDMALDMLVGFYGRCGRHSNTGVEEYMGLVMGVDLYDR